jgi:hypothetical protein
MTSKPVDKNQEKSEKIQEVRKFGVYPEKKYFFPFCPLMVTCEPKFSYFSTYFALVIAFFHSCAPNSLHTTPLTALKR